MTGSGHVEQIKLICSCRLLYRAVIKYAQGLFVGTPCRSELLERIVHARQLEGREAEVGVDIQSTSQRLHSRLGVITRKLGNPADEVSVGVQGVLCEHILGDLHGKAELTTVGSLHGISGRWPGISRCPLWLADSL
jgi:hypothetical protein